MQSTIDQAKFRALRRRLADFLDGCASASMVALGERLGLYAALACAGALSSDELATRTGLHERWLREWLQQQAAAGLLEYAGGRFSLAPEAVALLADPDNIQGMASAFDGMIMRVEGIGRIQSAFHSGAGVAPDDRGPEAARATEAAFRNWYRQVLVQRAIPMLDEIEPRLRAGARAADVGCGSGVALCELARAYPASEFHGYDISRQALARAEANRAAAGLANLRFHRVPEEVLPADGSVDLITTFDCVHDMTRPHEVVAAIRASLRTDGAWFIADIDGRPSFAENLAGNDLAARMYATSVLGCLSTGMSEPGGAGLGTLGLPEPAMRELALGAGFTRFRRVDLPSPVNAFYLARP